MKNSKYSVIAVVYTVGLLYCASGALPSNSSSETSPDVTDQHQQCPTLFFWNVTSHKCDSSHHTGVLHCIQANNQTWLNWRYCITYDDRTGSTAMGRCPYGDLKAEHIKRGHFILLPENQSKVNEAMCGRANREGLLCSRCKPSYGPSALSYDHTCVMCSNNYFGWLLHLCIVLVPSTIFFLIIVLCQVHTTTAPLNFFILACQFASVSLIVSSPEIMYQSGGARIVYGIVLTLFTSWNLDFFRLLIPPFCASESLSNLQVLSMDYIVPLLLTVVMYICIQQHARGCRLLVCLWKPFGYCLTLLTSQYNYNPAVSIVPIFASFLLLSSTKLLTVSFSLLLSGQPVANVSNIGVISIQRNVLYYDPNIIFFSQDHLLYAVLAIFVSSTFVILPCLVLILYPTRLFQKFLNLCGIGCHAVHAFADAFNGCYKNGTNGTHDYRCFAGFYLLLRVLALGSVTHSTTHSPIFRLIVIVFVFIFALASPYKNKMLNVLDSFGLTLYACSVCIPEYKTVFLLLVAVLIVAYIAVLISCIIILKLNCCCSQKLKALVDRMSGVRDNSTPHTRRQEVTEHLPDRLKNPDGYRLLTEMDEQSHSFNNNGDVPKYGSI